MSNETNETNTNYEHITSTVVPGSWRNAKGVFPWKPGDEEPEDMLRRARGGDGWISVDDRLPKEPSAQVVIVDGYFWDKRWYYGDGVWDVNEERNEKVTHWLELPPFPIVKLDKEKETTNE